MTLVIHRNSPNAIFPSFSSFLLLLLQVAKHNWKTYGNPDGRQSLEVSIGLPTFLLEEGNYHAVLIMYLIVLVVVIPTLVALYYSKSRQYGEKVR